ncbi:PAAR domain-containing protein [Thiomonas sp. FB-6]|uniref:PAAR domain-containing protein n=1 Tax=Thiomonas sp. FB-6 TaxID=1158291 RepID=UPI00036318A9|nr:PAAR domain-containing protein [Thiomonas sp. FB-6]
MDLPPFNLMRRHHICLGDATTAGGVVVSASSTVTILGRPAALEGDTVDCRACKSTGVITCAGPRHHETFGGRNTALEGDLCACRCRKPPELVASQQGSYQTVGGSGVGMPPGAATHTAALTAPHGTDGSTASDPVHDRPWLGFQLDETASCEGVSCRVLFDDGSHAYAACMTGNRLRLHGVAARSATQVDYLLGEVRAEASLIAFLLERIAT